MSETEGEPVRFVRDLVEKTSILVLYEDIDYSRSLEFLFLENGLANGQKGIYLSPQTAQTAERLMSRHGIKSKYFKNGHLGVSTTTNKKREHVVSTIDDFVRDRDPPTRIVIQHDVFSPDQYGDLLAIESFLATKFEKFESSIFVSYNAEFLSDAKLMQKVINFHDYVIFAPTFGKGLVVNTK